MRATVFEKKYVEFGNCFATELFLQRRNKLRCQNNQQPKKQEVKKAGQQVAGHTTAFTKNYSEDTFNSESFVSRSETPLFKNSSTFLAHSLPSLMAHTTRD